MTCSRCWSNTGPGFGTKRILEIGYCIETTTLHLDHDNDYLQIYIKHANSCFALTDEGYILDDFVLYGHEIDSSIFKEVLKETLNGFGTHANGVAPEVEASAENFPLQKHNLVQVMIAIDDLFRIVLPNTQHTHILRTISRPNRETTQAMVFSWMDVGDARFPDARAYAILNDSKNDFR